MAAVIQKLNNSKSQAKPRIIQNSKLLISNSESVFLHQLSLVLLCLGEECPVVFRVGIEGAVVQGGFYWLPFLQEGVRVVGEESVGEALVDILHGLVRGMDSE